MARFLMLAEELSNAGRVEGDPVSIKDDANFVTTASGDWYFSAQEDIRRWVAEGNLEGDFPALFYTVDIDGMPLITAQRFFQKWVRAAVPGDPEYELPDPEDRYVELGPHRWQLGVADKLPAQMKNQLRNDRYLVVPYDIPTLNSYVTDRAGLDVWITDTPIDP